MNKMNKNKENSPKSYIGQNIKNIRGERGWSQGEVAVRLGVSGAAFSKMETGLTDINLSRLDQIAHILQVDMLELFKTQQEDSKPPVIRGAIQKRLLETEKRITELQDKIIRLYEELRGR